MQLLDLPFITAPLPGIGGRLKVRPELFKVTELMNSRSDAVKEVTQSNGKHAFITLRREGYTTPEIQSALAEAFGLKPEEVGYAGLKDKHAICTQTFSLPRDRIQPVELRKPEGIYGIERVLRQDCRWQVVDDPPPAWHQSKLRKGELRGNAFEIVVSDLDVPPADALERAHAIAARLRHTGWANFFGPQRFGKAGPARALQRGTDLLKGRGADGAWRKRRAHAAWLDTLLLNGMQSALFNEYLTERIGRGLFDTVLLGDLVSQPHSAAKPRMVRLKPAADTSCDGAADSNGDAPSLSTMTRDEKLDALPEEENSMLAEFTLSHTGPLFGGGMPKPSGRPASLEAEVWERHITDVTLGQLKQTSLYGGRRVCRLPLPPDFLVEEAPGRGLRFCFSLPRGAYATSLLREFMKSDDAEALGEGGEDAHEGSTVLHDEGRSAGSAGPSQDDKSEGDPGAAGDLNPAKAMRTEMDARVA